MLRQLTLMAVFVAPAMAESPDANWHQAPFRIMAGDHYLDTAPEDTAGHAAPFFIDIDGDGRRDLVVGSLSGQFRLLRNVGSDAKPKFTADVQWLRTEDGPARVPGFCCVAAVPQLVDIDGDGIPDLSSGSYYPGALYWFKGMGGGKYFRRHMLTDMEGRPIFVNGGGAYNDNEKSHAYASAPAWVDWNADGKLDLVIGNLYGKVVVRRQGNAADPVSMPIRSQPVFVPAHFQKEIEVELEPHAAPAVADWDGDGLWDLLIAGNSGSVYLLRNTGTIGDPKFTTREQLLGEGTEVQWLEKGEPPGRGRRSYVQAVDYDLDGKLDLLVGDWFMSRSPRADLDAAERKQVRALLKELEALDTRAGRPYWRGPSKYPKELIQKARELDERLQPYLERHRFEGYSEAFTQRAHGTVWVYLRK